MSDFGHEMFNILSIDKSKMFVFQVFSLARLSNLKLVKTTAESRGQIKRQMWYKQRKVLSGCLDKFLGFPSGFALGKSLGAALLPWKASDLPQGKSGYPWDHPRVNLSRQPLRTFRYLYHICLSIYPLDSAVVLTSFRLLSLARPNTWKTNIFDLSLDRIWKIS